MLSVLMFLLCDIRFLAFGQIILFAVLQACAAGCSKCYMLLYFYALICSVYVIICIDTIK